MKTKITMEWLMAAGVRAIKTVAQTALGMFTIGAAFNEINWTYVISVSITAGIFSLLTSLAGLPEVGTDGTLKIDTSDPSKDVYRLELDGDLSELASKSTVKFTVDPTADLSQK